MDPNATLERLREVMQILSDDYGYGPEAEELFSSLDEWLSKGGFLPEAWRGNGRLVTQYSGEMKIIEDEFNDSYDDGERWTVWTEGRSDD